VQDTIRRLLVTVDPPDARGVAPVAVRRDGNRLRPDEHADPCRSGDRQPPGQVYADGATFVGETFACSQEAQY
jgi:hypothetical protein